MFIREGASVLDVVPGKLGDRWLVSTLGCLFLTKGFFYRVVPADQGFDSGLDGSGGGSSSGNHHHLLNEEKTLIRKRQLARQLEQHLTQHFLKRLLLLDNTKYEKKRAEHVQFSE